MRHMDRSAIGFFDSGVGGITVLSEAIRQLPKENFIYYADTAHVPYGTKEKHVVKQYIFEAVDFLVNKNIKALVVACNTATSIAVRELRGMYSFPIVGMEPAVKPAIENGACDGRRVLVLATPLTLQEEKFHNLVAKVDHEHVVDYLPFPELVELAEQYIFDDEAVIPVIIKKLGAYDLCRYKTLVLGCTHFPIFKNAFRKVLPTHIDLIDGSSGTVRYLKKLLEEQDLLSRDSDGGKIQYYTSGKLVRDTRSIKAFNHILSINP